MMDLKFKRKPKLRIHRLNDDQRVVPIRLKIPLPDKKYIIDTFDWSLREEEIILPSEFAAELVASLNFSQNYVQFFAEQIQAQLIEYIEKNTFFPRNRNKIVEKAQEEEYIPPAKIKKYQRFNTTQFTKRVCKFCKNCHKNLVIQCTNCKFPFRILELLNMRDVDIKDALTFFHLCYKNFPVIQNSQILDDIQIEDFQSLNTIKDKLEYSFKDLFKKQEVLAQLDHYQNNLDQVKFFKKNYELIGKKDEEIEQNIQISSESDVTQQDFEIKRPRGRPKRSKTYKKLVALKKKIKLG